jgi:hypothetical protein
MKYLLGALLVFGLLAQSGQAAIVFTLSPASQDIVQGDIGVFNVFIRTDTVAPVVVDAIDMNLVAGAGNGTGGVFLPSSATFLLGSTPFDLITSGQAFSTNFQLGGISVPTTNTLYATANLNTTGIALGQRTMSFQTTNNRLFVNSPTAGSIPTIAVNATYTIVAVPEPGTLAMVGIGLFGVVLATRYRARNRR